MTVRTPQARRGREQPTAKMLSVYHGQRCVGFILPRGKLGFEAFDTDERSLGLYATQKLTADALSDGKGAP
jgi:hypothetical protein